MGIAERRSRERAELQEKILDTARTLFARHGYEAVTLRLIAEEIEYAPSVIYSFFKDKEALIRTICEHDFAALAEAFVQSLQITDPIERIRQMGQIYIEFAVRHPNHYRLMFMTPSPVEPSAAELSLKGDPLHDGYAALKQAVEEAIKGGYLRFECQDLELAAQTLWAGVHGVASLHIVLVDDPWFEWQPLEIRAQTMIDGLLHGLVISPDGKPS
jgi:AcrR family transcriptional regulator